MKCVKYVLSAALCASLFSSASAQISARTAYATRAYWVKSSFPNPINQDNSWKDRIQLRALKLFKEISKDYSLPKHERGYAKLYLGKYELAMGHLAEAEGLLMEADEESDALWGEELLLDHFQRLGAHSAHDKKRKELARQYMIRRDMVLRDEFDPQRIHFLNTRSCIDCSRIHSIKYRSMYNQSCDRRLRLSAFFDFCNDRIDSLAGDCGVLSGQGSYDACGWKCSFSNETVDVWDRSSIGFTFMETLIGKVEGHGEIWCKDGCADADWCFRLNIRTTLFPASGMDYTTTVFYRGVLRKGKIFLLDADDRLFESPFVALDGKGGLSVVIYYRTSCGNVVARFLKWVGKESVNKTKISFQLPKKVLCSIAGQPCRDRNGSKLKTYLCGYGVRRDVCRAEQLFREVLSDSESIGAHRRLARHYLKMIQRGEFPDDDRPYP